MARRTVAVVGGGCAGVLTARELLRCTSAEVILIEPGEPGGGVAYGSAQPWHLLNSRAGAMSADPDDPGQFVRWANAQGIPAGPADFLGRRDYGRYLREAFARAEADYPDRLAVRRAAVSAVRPEAEGCAVVLDGGSTVRADDVVLAVGNPAATQPIRIDHVDYVRDPWRPDAFDQIPADAPVLLVGAGLTAIDVALTLTADGRRNAPITAVSRRGQLPLSHTVAAAPPAAPALDDCNTLRDVVRAVRASAAEAGDWRAVVDGLRPHLDELWVALTPGEQDAFLRHLARPWECHRHRMAPPVATRVAELRAEGLLEVRSGGIRSVEPIAAGGLHVELEAGRQWFGAVVNCAGPGRLPAAAGPLVGGLLDTGVARVGPHGLGLDIDSAGRLIATGGGVQPHLWLVGSLRRGARWETTAVPEIRAQARRLAADLAELTESGPLLRAA
jgi:uncharacterized NAD(P)/FAD-binding protein YdhS